MDALGDIVAQARREFAAAADSAALENAKARYVGKAGAITTRLKALAALAPDARRAEGAAINAAKTLIEDALAARRSALGDAKLARALAAEALDVTLPGRGIDAGAMHPLTRTLERVATLFHSMGFVAVSYTHLRAHETGRNLVCRLLLEKKKMATQ